MTTTPKSGQERPKRQALRWSLLFLALSMTTSSVHAESAAFPLQIQSLMNRSLSSMLPTTQELVAGTLGLGLYYGLNNLQDGGIQVGASRAATGPVGNRKTRKKARVALETAQQQRLQSFETMARETEAWTERMLEETGRDGSSVETNSGWVPVECNKAMKHVLNPHGKTKQFVKWMVDSRTSNSGATLAATNPEPRDTAANPQQLHPCMKVYAEIDAPFDLVCRYLSQASSYKQYNSLLIDQADVEEITPHSKICWSQTKKLLFIQPRDFVTFCTHKWRQNKDTQCEEQVILHQAVEHPKYKQKMARTDVTPANPTSTTTTDDENKHQPGLRAFALQGATILSQHPDDATKTKITLLAHCNCGHDIPEWAVRTAVGVLAPVKPFEIVHRIQVGVQKSREELERLESQANYSSGKKQKKKIGKLQMKPKLEKPKLKLMKKPKIGMKKNKDQQQQRKKNPVRSQRPAGMAQMGYACFWPEGGGLIEEQ